MTRWYVSLLAICVIGGCASQSDYAPLVSNTQVVCQRPPPPTPVVLHRPKILVRQTQDGEWLVGVDAADYLKMADNFQTLSLALKERSLIIRYLNDCIAQHEKSDGADPE